MPGARERFQLKRPPLGGGAFGVVYLADDLELRQQVAIKVPHDEDKERALIHEARLMAQIRDLHEPHVVALYDLHELSGQRVIVMEYAGKSLRGMIGKIEEHPHAPLRVDLAIDIGIQICLGLQALHHAFGDAGVFHRDIKPENVLIRERDGLAKIADFGIARVLEASGCGSTTVGTPPYMAPELLDPDSQGHGADYRADVYGVGVTLYEMFTGRLPFDPLDDNGRAKPPGRYQREICAGNPRPPAEVSGIDSALSDIVLRAMHRDVLQRFQTVTELREALESARARISIDSCIAAAWREDGQAARESALREIVRRFPREPKAYRNLAWFLNGQVRFSEAMQALDEGCQMCKASGELMVDLALACFQMGDIGRAVDTLERSRKHSLPAEVASRVEPLLRSWRRRQR